MKTTRYFISTTTKLTSGMEYSKDRFNSRYTGLFMDADRHTTSIISYCYDIIFIDLDIDSGRKSS